MTDVAPGGAPEPPTNPRPNQLQSPKVKADRGGVVALAPRGDGVWPRLLQTAAHFRAESQRRWWLYALVAVGTVLVQDRLGEAADLLISAVSATGVAAEVIRSLIGPLGAIALVVIVIAGHAYVDTRRSVKRLHDGATLLGADPPGRVSVVALNAVELEHAVSMIGALHSELARLQREPGVAVPSMSVAERGRNLLDWEAGRDLLRQEGEEIAHALRELALQDSDDGYHKDLVSSVADRRAQGWTKDVDEFETYWSRRPALSAGSIRRLIDDLSFTSSPVRKPVWRQRRVREVELRLTRLGQLIPLKPVTEYRRGNDGPDTNG
ncbi:MAG: hypothetical protein M0Z49_03975 [Chloroflexi bacterium]|nr:hypothetical protein [Chloroflexota bacterium]